MRYRESVDRMTRSARAVDEPTSPNAPLTLDSANATTPWRDPCALAHLAVPAC